MITLSQMLFTLRFTVSLIVSFKATVVHTYYVVDNSDALQLCGINIDRVLLVVRQAQELLYPPGESKQIFSLDELQWEKSMRIHNTVVREIFKEEEELRGT